MLRMWFVNIILRHAIKVSFYFTIKTTKILATFLPVSFSYVHASSMLNVWLFLSSMRYIDITYNLSYHHHHLTYYFTHLTQLFLFLSIFFIIFGSLQTTIWSGFGQYVRQGMQAMWNHEPCSRDKKWWRAPSPAKGNFNHRDFRCWI